MNLHTRGYSTSAVRFANCFRRLINIWLISKYFCACFCRSCSCIIKKTFDNAAPDSCCAKRSSYLPTYPRLISTTLSFHEKCTHQCKFLPPSVNTLFFDYDVPDSCCAECPLHIPTYPRLVSTAATVRKKTWVQRNPQTDRPTTITLRSRVNNYTDVYKASTWTILPTFL